jgi:lysyl-tRNA synthetase class 2
MDRLIMYLTNNASIQEILFFPQMRPETKSVKIELNENEQAIFAAMQKLSESVLPDLRAKFAEMSNKVWDNSVKTLTKNNLLKVSKEHEILYIRLV